MLSSPPLATYGPGDGNDLGLDRWSRVHRGNRERAGIEGDGRVFDIGKGIGGLARVVQVEANQVDGDRDAVAAVLPP